MARPALLRLAVLGNVRLVIRLDLVCADLLRGKQGVGAQHEVFDTHLFGHLETSGIAVVERADCLRGNFRLCELRVGLNSMLGDLALLCAQLRKLAGDRLRCEPGIGQSAGELLHQEIATQGPIERLRAHPLVSKRRVVALPNERMSSERSEEHTSELQSLAYLVCRLLLE